MSSPNPTGSQADVAQRLNLLLPVRWFTGLTPVKDALVSGIATTLSAIYALLAYVRLQTRIKTATDGFLELIAGDFFGSSLPRLAGETDPQYLTRIQSGLVLERSTRAGLNRVLTQLTGNIPIIVEPLRPADLGGYGMACGYSVAGHYGSLALPYQVFATVARGRSTSDTALYAAIDQVKPVATVVWVQLH